LRLPYKWLFDYKYRFRLKLEVILAISYEDFELEVSLAINFLIKNFRNDVIFQVIDVSKK